MLNIFVILKIAVNKVKYATTQYKLTTDKDQYLIKRQITIN